MAPLDLDLVLLVVVLVLVVEIEKLVDRSSRTGLVRENQIRCGIEDEDENEDGDLSIPSGTPSVAGPP